MDFNDIDKLSESHEMDLTKDLLRMSVGDMLDKLEGLDTYGDAEYEIVEAALKALNSKIVSQGYSSDKDLDFESVEVGDEVDFTEDSLEDDDSMPSFGDFESGSSANQNQEDSMGDFQF
jgi:hypothetical protein